MLGSFDGRDVPTDAAQGGAEGADRLTEYPPVVTSAGAFVFVSLWLYVVANPLINRWESVAHALSGQTEKIDDHHSTRHRRNIAPVTVRSNVLVESGHYPEPKLSRLFGCDDETGAVKYGASTTESLFASSGTAEVVLGPMVKSE